MGTRIEKQVRSTLTDDERKKFDMLKEYFGLRTDAEAIRLLITMLYEIVITKRSEIFKL